jgi:hypothetical protein
MATSADGFNTPVRLIEEMGAERYGTAIKKWRRSHANGRWQICRSWQMRAKREAIVTDGNVCAIVIRAEYNQPGIQFFTASISVGGRRYQIERDTRDFVRQLRGP